MDSTSDAGIWKHWKFITGALTFLFVASVAADIALWYSLQKTNTAAETLNEIIANQPPAPKSDTDKIKLLDNLAAAHNAAVVQIAGKSSQNTVPVNISSSSPSAQQSINRSKIKLLDSLRQSH